RHPRHPHRDRLPHQPEGREEALDARVSRGDGAGHLHRAQRVQAPLHPAHAPRAQSPRSSGCPPMSPLPAPRHDGRVPDQLRRVVLTRDYLLHPEGSVLVEFGDTKVICTASLEEKVPAFLKGQAKGWVTAESGMLPRSTNTRMGRERGGPSGRSQEIQRLVGRSLRAVVDMAKLGERTVWMDCDVIQADGGTRTAAITGSWVALSDALERLVQGGMLPGSPLRENVAAISVGMVGGGGLPHLGYAG